MDTISSKSLTGHLLRQLGVEMRCESRWPAENLGQMSSEMSLVHLYACFCSSLMVISGQFRVQSDSPYPFRDKVPASTKEELLNITRGV